MALQTKVDQDQLRKMHASAIASVFPSDEVLTFLMSRGSICEIRFCSVPDERGELPEAQYIKFGRPWVGKVQLVMKRSANNGYRNSQWLELFEMVCMTAVQVTEAQAATVGKKKALWQFFQELYKDARSSELLQNVMQINFKRSLHAAPPPGELTLLAKAPAAAPADAPDPPPTEDQLVAFASQKAVQPKGGGAGQLSWNEIDDYIKRKVQTETERVLEGQVPKKRRRRTKIPPVDKAPAKAVAESAEQSQQGDQDLSQHSVGLTLSQMVLSRELAQTHPDLPEWKVYLIDFLQKEHHYGKQSSRLVCAHRVISGLLTDSCKSNQYFQVKKQAGLGALYPIPPPDYLEKLHAAPPGKSPPASNLELHRCALLLERHAERVLRDVAGAVGRMGDFAAFAALGPKAVADLQVIWAVGGGQRGHGKGYWPASVDAAHCLFVRVEFNARSEVYKLLMELREARPRAFSRRYLVMDEVNWGLPYIWKLFFLKEESSRAKTRLTATDIKRCFEELTRFRETALHMDAYDLVRYGRWFLDYIDLLFGIAATLKVEVPEVEYARALFAGASVIPANNDTIRCRLQEESREMQAVLMNLGLASSTAVTQAAALNSALLQALSTDSHKRNDTRFLSPSPSLQDARYDPVNYLEAQDQV